MQCGTGSWGSWSPLQHLGPCCILQEQHCRNSTAGTAAGRQCWPAWHCQSPAPRLQIPHSGDADPSKTGREGRAAHGHSQTPCPVCKRSNTAPVAQDVMEIHLPNSSQPGQGFCSSVKCTWPGACAGAAHCPWSTAELCPEGVCRTEGRGKMRLGHRKIYSNQEQLG